MAKITKSSGNLRRARKTLGQRLCDMAHEQHVKRQHRGARGQNRQHRAAALCRPDPDGRQHDHRQHDDDVLPDQKAKCDLAVQAVDLALVRKQLDDDDR